MVLVIHFKISSDESLILPQKRLIQGFALGAALYLAMLFIKTVLPNSGTLLYTLSMLTGAGLVFLYKQYLIYRKLEFIK